MKNFIFTISVLLIFFYSSFAQVIPDTFSTTINYMPQQRPFGSGNYKEKLLVRYGPYELAQKGIVPGSIIHGLSYYKGSNGYYLSGTMASFEIRFRSGGQDSSFSYLNSYPNTPFSYFIDSMNFGGLGNLSSIFILGSTMTIPSSLGWIPPLMVDVPFVYIGGSLEVFTFWNAPSNSTSGTVNFKLETNNGPNINNAYFYLFNGNIQSAMNNRPSLIIWHTGPPPPCTGYPDGGTISGLTNVCKNQLFTLYLNNPSAGPDITYQWQQTATTPLSWSNIAGATNPSLKTSTAAPTTYRCKVTCNNSGHFSYSSSFNIVPHFLKIDSVITSVNGNVVTLNGYVNDTTFYVYQGYCTSTLDTLMSQTMPFTKIYTTDGTYNLIYGVSNTCNADTVNFSVTVGCAGSPTFHDSIASSNKSVCPGGSTTLTLLDTLPANYTSEWQYYYWTGPVSIPGLNGNTAVVSPVITTYYHHKGTCTISGNYKYSNWDTITITPPPTAGTIQAQNTTTNYYNFTNNGMSNAQTYKWFFGDGDSSTSLAPSHHYGPAGTYTVAFVATNSGNSCTDTAFTTVNITTGIEEVQSKLFSVSPNPFNESFTVTCPSAKGTIQLMDITGKALTLRQAQGDNCVVRLSLSKPQTTIDLKGYALGIYLIKYQNESQTETVKIIKQ